METFGLLIQTIIGWLQIPFTIYGYTITLWAVMVYSLIASFVIWIIVRLFDFGG